VAATLYELIPRGEQASNDMLLGRFLEYTEARQLQLYPAQESAILELFEEKNVILNTPTGSGKTLVATALHFQAIARGRRSIYTCPIKALVNEKFMALCREFGPGQRRPQHRRRLGESRRPLLCCTAEILANIALREGAAAGVQEVIMDEFHYYADRDRGVAWQVPLLTLAAGALPPDVRDARRHDVLREGTHAAERPPDRCGQFLGPARAAGPRLFRAAAGKDAGKSRR